MVEVAGTLGRGDKTTMERGAGVPSPGSTSRCANTAILCSLVLHDLRDLTQFAFYFCSGRNMWQGTMNINAGILAALLTITLHYITFVQTNNGAEHDTITSANTFLSAEPSL